jgi:hypothetical protein
MIVSGFDPEAKKGDIESEGEDYAVFLQELVANLFRNEKSVGGALEPNDEQYTKWKIKHGYSPKRGHLTEHTQDVLDESDLMNVTVKGHKGSRTCVVSISRNTFYEEVGGGFEGYRSYIERYEVTKVPNETICAFKQGWARYAGRFFKNTKG